MKRLILGLGFLAAASLALAVPAAERPLDLDDLARLRDVSHVQISPDGARVAYAVRAPDLEKDRNDTDIWMTSWDGSQTSRLTTSRDSETSPRWSPDGRYLAFLSSRGEDDEEDQLWLLPLGGGEAEKVTKLPGGVEDYDWAPDGKRLVLVAEDPDPEATSEKDSSPNKKKTKKPIVIDRYQFKLDNYGYLLHRRKHLYVLDLETRKTEPLTSGDMDELLPAWSPDGRSIAFVSKRGPDPDRTDVWNVWTIEPRAGAAPRALTGGDVSHNHPDWESRLAWSPDSRSVAYLEGRPDKLVYYGLHRLAVVPASGGASRILTPDLDRNVASPRFTPDGSAILFTLEDDQAVDIARVPVSGGAIERVLRGRSVVSEFSVASDGRIAAIVGTPRTPNEVYAVENGSTRRLSKQNDAWLAGVRLGAVEETKFRSKDGTEIHGFVVRPPDAAPDHRIPAILRIHGGPVGQFDNSFSFEWQFLASRGYLVIVANPRGSSGRGEDFQKAIYADWGDKDVEDVLAAVDHAVARGWADPVRLGVGGWSYGGMLTNYTIASTTRFRGATSGASISNILAGYGTDQYIREYEQELGTPWKNLATWLKISFPFLHADRIRTPTLFLCGEKDFNVPLLNSEQMYQALRSLGVPTELVIYPGQYHGIRKPSYVRDRLERYAAWYDRYVRPGGAR
jgi:dipeptidyl aminopeptidase/acylaminoacyl peptidase